MSDDAIRYRRLKFSDAHTRDRNLDYLRLLELPDERLPPPPRSREAGAQHVEPQRPQLLEGEEAPTPTKTPEATVPFEPSQPIRNWKLSARLDSALLAEIYGAAAELNAAGATVSSLVEEALRLYVPRLRSRYNEGRPFTPRGPRSRAPKAAADSTTTADPSESAESEEPCSDGGVSRSR